MRTILKSTALAGLLSLLSVAPLHAGGGYESINCDAPGASLQKKINNAQEGGYISITGTCSDGPFIIWFDLNLESSDGATLSAVNGSDSVLDLNSSRSSITGITIDATGANMGMNLSGASANLRDIVVENATWAGLNAAGSNILSFGSIFRNNGGPGANIHGASSAWLFNNTFEQNGTGVSVSTNGSASIVGDSTVDGNDAGVIVGLNGSVQLSDSTIKNSTWDGILVWKQGVLTTWGEPSMFVNNGGSDVHCAFRGIVDVSTPQEPNGGTTSTDSSCLVFGLIFGPIFNP